MTRTPRRATPRPVYDRPTAIPASDRVRHIWGDSTSGYVIDRLYLSSEMLHVLEFALPPGGRFGHSRDNPTIFAADELLYVLDGVLMLSDPSTGETQRVRVGEAAFFRRDTWHHGRASGDHGVRVLEFFSPTPATGATGAYARTQPYLHETQTLDQRLLGSWPVDTERFKSERRITPVRENDLAWGSLGEIELAFFAATEHLTVVRCHLRAGAMTDDREDSGETFVLLLTGTLTIFTPTGPDANCLYLEPGDAAVLPPGTPHSYLSSGDAQAVWLAGIGPGWVNAPHTQPQPQPRTETRRGVKR